MYIIIPRINSFIYKAYPIKCSHYILENNIYYFDTQIRYVDKQLFENCWKYISKYEKNIDSTIIDITIEVPKDKISKIVKLEDFTTV